MWQRIQTLLLLISAGLAAALCLSPAYRLASPEGLVEVSYWQLRSPYFGILLGIVAFLIVLALVVYKSRILQMRLAVLSAIMALGMQLWLDVLHLRGAGFPLDGHFPAADLHQQPAGRPRRFPGPAGGGKRLPGAGTPQTQT